MWDLIRYAANIFLLCLLGRIVLSWFPSSGPGVLESIRRVLFTITEPVLGPVRRLLPMVRIGGMALDLSPLVVFIAIEILLAWLPR